MQGALGTFPFKDKNFWYIHTTFMEGGGLEDHNILKIFLEKQNLYVSIFFNLGKL